MVIPAGRYKARIALAVEQHGTRRKCSTAGAFRSRRPVDEEREGVPLQPINFAWRIKLRVRDPPRRFRRVDQRLPGHRRSENRKPKIYAVVIGIHHDKKALVDIALAARGEELTGRPAQDVAKRERNRVPPILGRRLFARRSNPSYVFDPRLRQHLAAQKAWTREDAVTAPEMDQIADEPSQVLVLRTNIFPVEPGGFVVLAIGIVVAALGPSDLVAGEQHRHTERQYNRRQHVALLAVAQRYDLRIVRRPLDTAIPTV